MAEKKEETFLLVSLDEKKAQNLAQVISNDTCRKILNLLSKKDATETEIANELMIPISTAHYNIKHLLENNLVEADEFHYSQKGKEVLHYSLSNKLIIIAPRKSEGILERLKSILPAFVSVCAVAAVISIFFRIQKNAMLLTQSAEPFMAANKASASEQILSSGVSASPAAAEIVSQSINSSSIIWFLCGGIFALGIFLLFSWLKEGKK